MGAALEVGLGKEVELGKVTEFGLEKVLGGDKALDKELEELEMDMEDNQEVVALHMGLVEEMERELGME